MTLSWTIRYSTPIAVVKLDEKGFFISLLSYVHIQSGRGEKGDAQIPLVRMLIVPQNANHIRRACCLVLNIVLG